MRLAVQRLVSPLREIEIGAQFAVDPREQIQVEGRGDPLGIVVGRLQHRLVLFQVDTDQ